MMACSEIYVQIKQQGARRRSTLHGILIILFVLIVQPGFSQQNPGSAIISGKVLIENDRIAPNKPCSVILRKDWPVTAKEFEWQKLDTTDFSFRIRVDLESLTTGKLIVNFFPGLDTGDVSRYKHWYLPVAEDFLSDGGYSAHIMFHDLRFVLEPGDSVHVVINFDKVNPMGQVIVVYSGPGSAKNNLMRSMFMPGQNFSRSFDLPLAMGMRYEDSLMHKKLEDLSVAKDSISRACYHLLATDARFENLSKKHALIRAYLYNPSMSAGQKRSLARKHYTFMDSLTLKQEYLVSPKYRQFLGLYLEYLNRIITGKDIAYSYDSTSYYLATSIFEEEIFKAFMFEKLSDKLEMPYYYMSGMTAYFKFLQRFKDTPEATRLSSVYNRHRSIARGNIPPDLELSDYRGRDRKLSDLKGKVVLASTAQALLFSLEDGKPIKRFESILNKYGDDLVIVAIDIEYGGTETLKRTIDYYINKGKKSPDQYAYLFQNGYRYSFVIGKDGVVRDCVRDLNVPGETLSSLIAEKYTIITKIDNLISRNLRLIVLLLSIGISLTLALLFVMRNRKRRQEVMRQQLNSELKAIRSQLNPHFIFNSLNSIQNYINKNDAKTANIQLSKFAVLMRKVIELSEQPNTSLSEEIEVNRNYIELEQLRYGFNWSIDVDASIDVHNTEIPGMIIQPFVENAIVHGMADLGKKGELRIFIEEKGNGKIEVEIRDNGPGFKIKQGKGFGLKSSRERIDLLNRQNREKIDLMIESPVPGEGGTRIKLIIPKKY